MFLDSVLSIVAPFECLGCLAEGRLVCSDCRAKLPLADKRCYKCHVPRRDFSTCPPCRPSSPLASVQPATLYDGLGRSLVLKLKFGRAQGAASEIADIMAGRLGLDPAMAAYGDLVLTYTPTATRRVRQRGYDQSRLLARALSRRSGIPYQPLLARFGQSEQLGADKFRRRRQSRAAYYATAPARTKGVRVLLIDDVCTTGSSLEAAAQVLLAAGARQIDGLVFAKA